MYIRLDNQVFKQLRARKMPGDLLQTRDFELEPHVVSIVSKVDGLKTKNIPKQVQLSKFTTLLENPIASPYLMIISSMPNDGKAKHVGAFIMSKVINLQLHNKVATKGRQLPLWHTLTGSFQDSLRDSKTLVNPSLLLFSNITDESTNVKIEKLRDLLEIYSHLPRIVMITGTDAMTFANTRLRLPVNHVLNLSTAKKQTL